MDLSTLEALEQIKQVKARYFRLVDNKQWKEWGELFTEDVTAVYYNAPKDRPNDGLPGLQCTGRKNLVEAATRALSRGIWAMFDYLRLPNCIFKGYGHYEEEYVKEANGWKIKSVLLTRLHCDIQWENQENT